MILGVTGAPGSGKSLLVRIMADEGWAVVDADRRGKDVVEGSPDILAALARIFGADIIGPGNALDRRLLARRAFATGDSTRLLNETVHPALIREVTGTLASLREAGTNAVADCALIFEWGIEGCFDRVACLRADESLRRARLAARDRRTPGEISRLFAAQLPEEEKARRSDIILINNGSVERLAAYGFMLANLPRCEERGTRWIGSHPQND